MARMEGAEGGGGQRTAAPSGRGRNRYDEPFFLWWSLPNTFIKADLIITSAAAPSPSTPTTHFQSDGPGLAEGEEHGPQAHQ